MNSIEHYIINAHLIDDNEMIRIDMRLNAKEYIALIEALKAYHDDMRIKSDSINEWSNRAFAIDDRIDAIEQIGYYASFNDRSIFDEQYDDDYYEMIES